jgi:hypothetical protein
MKIPWDEMATFFLEGTLLSGKPDPRFRTTLRGCFAHCLSSKKPIQRWVVVETEAGSLRFRGPEIEALLQNQDVREEARKGRDDALYEPVVRRLSS